MGEMISSFDGTKLYFNREMPEQARAAAVIVHGLCEHQGRYDYLADLFHQAGIGTYRFDHRGHGRSEGERTYYDDFNELLDDTNVVVDMAIADNPDLPVFLIGHSMGGFTVALYLSLIHIFLLFLGLGSADYLSDLLGNGSLADPVIGNCQFIQHILRTLRGSLHGHHSGILLAGVGFHQTAIDKSGYIVWYDGIDHRLGRWLHRDFLQMDVDRYALGHAEIRLRKR